MAHPFRTAVEARDHEAMTATLAEDVQFHSPVAFRPFDGREATAGVLAAIMSVFEDFEYTDELESGDTVALLFRARVGDKAVQGIDYLRHRRPGPDRRVHGDAASALGDHGRGRAHGAPGRGAGQGRPAGRLSTGFTSVHRIVSGRSRV